MTTSTFSTASGHAVALTPARLIGFIGIASLALIAGAWYFQLVVGLVPCKLCLEQRLPHYAAIALALLGALLARSARLQGLVLLGLAGLMGVSTGLALYPVSYSHLDVYKRQAKLNEVEHSIAIENEGFANLVRGSRVAMEEVLRRAPENWYIEAQEAKALGLIEDVI